MKAGNKKPRIHEHTKHILIFCKILPFVSFASRKVTNNFQLRNDKNI
jgi:hypothetical protein